MKDKSRRKMIAKKLGIRKKSSLLLYLVSNFLLLIIPVVILTINIRVTYNFQTQLLSRSREQLAVHFQQIMDNKLTEMEKVYRMMFTDEEVIQFMFVKDNSIQSSDYYTALQIVNKLALVYDRQSLISGLYLYFPANGSIITPTYRLNVRTFFDRILDMDNSSFDHWTQLLQEGYISLSNVSLADENTSAADHLYFVKTMYITTDVRYSPVIFFSISKDSIREVVDDLLTPARMSVEIVDMQDHSIIFDSGTEEASPYMTLASSVENLSYRIHYPANIFSDEYALSLRVILFSTILGFMTNIGIAVYLAYRNYKPIRNILTHIGIQSSEALEDENEFVQMQAIMDRTFARNEEMRPVYAEYYLRQLLEGHIRITEPVVEDVAASGINLSGGWFQIFEIIPTEEIDNRADLLKTVRSLMNEKMAISYETYYVSHENASLTVLVHYLHRSDSEEIFSRSGAIQSKIEDLLNQPVAIYIGRLLDEAEDLPEVYQQAEKAKIFVGWSGYAGILTYEELMNEQGGLFKYTIDDELRLVNYIRSYETEKISGEIDRLFHENAMLMKEDDPQAASAVRSMIIHLMSTYLKVSQQLGVEEDTFDYDIILTSSPRQARKWCIQAFCSLAEHAKEKSDSSSKAVQQVQSFIAEHYADDNLGLSVLADVAGLSAPYLSTLFKQTTGINLSEYMNRVRIDHAKKKIRDNSSVTIHDVALECGFVSDATFSRAFKKLVGITPGEYKKASETLLKQKIKNFER